MFIIIAEMVKDYKTNINGIPSLEDMLSMGKNVSGAFSVFVEYILVCVLGKKSNASKLCHQKLSSCSTPGDEALAFLLVENSWDKWMSQAIHPLDDPPSTKYSYEGSASLASRRYHGWKDAGMDRFKLLRRLVKEDRETDERKQFEEQFLEEKQKESKRRRVTYQDNNYYDLENDLDDMFCDTNESS